MSNIETILDITPLNSSISDISKFISGVDLIDVFFHSKAEESDAELQTQTILFTQKDKVAGFFTSHVGTLKLLTSDLSILKKEDVPFHDQSDSQMENSIIRPVVNLAYFAVDRSYQHRGIGQAMLQFFFQNIFICYMSYGLGVSGITLDSLPNAVDFYRQNGFQLLHGIDYDDGPNLKTYPMFISMFSILNKVVDKL